MVMGALTALIIDDDENRQSIVQALQEAGFQVIEATRSAEGLKRALDDSPRLLIVSDSMPPLEEVELLPVLRRLTDAPIITVGSGGEMAMVQALLQGSDVYLTRPVNLRELMARIRALLRRYGAAKGLNGEPMQNC